MGVPVHTLYVRLQTLLMVLPPADVLRGLCLLWVVPAEAVRLSIRDWWTVLWRDVDKTTYSKNSSVLGLDVVFMVEVSERRILRKLLTVPNNLHLPPHASLVCYQSKFSCLLRCRVSESFSLKRDISNQ